MIINRVETRLGGGLINHTQRVTTKFSKGMFHQIGEDIIDGVTRYKEVISKGYTKYRRAIMSYDANGKRIEASKYVEKLEGEAAKNQPVRHFGVWV